jgi:acetoin utilization protein AcuC
MSGPAGLVLCPQAAAYDHGPGHPLRPERVLLTWELIEAYGVDRHPNAHRLACRQAADEQIALVHTPEFIEATRRAGAGEAGDWSRFGFGPGDNPVFEGMHEAAAFVCGASLEAARAVLDGSTVHAFNAAGGLHHAMPARASGFCVYDDPAVAIAWMLRRGVERIAYVDVDVHHGDGPQAIFYDEPRVLTISLHESGEYLFPGTGFVEESGGGGAEGTKVNVPLAPGTGDAGWLRAFGAVVPALVRSFDPEVIVTQLGCDTHHTDPLAHLGLTMRAYREAYASLHELAHEIAEGRWVATGSGGYQWATVAPRAWTLAFAEMAGAEPADELPEAWVERVEGRLGSPVPTRLSEEPLPPGPADDEADRVIDLVRRRIFPLHGLSSSEASP